VRTVVVSDLHLGTTTGRDLLRHPSARAALVGSTRGADHVVLLGDVLELREAPLAVALGDSEPFFRELGEAVGDARVTLVPGNHDHRLAASLIDARRLEGEGDTLGADGSEPAPPSGPLARIAGWLESAELRLAYPGLWLRPDVYATHGHYLDCHLAVPSLERLAIAVTERVIGWPAAGPRTPDDYEAAVQPLYDLTYSLAQGSQRGRRMLRSGRSAAAWEQLSGSDGRSRLGARIVSGLVVPGAVGALNRAGLGPLTADLSGPSLRRSGLVAMAAVASSLDFDAGHVLFGHTHRSGPWPRDDPSEWELAGGGRLVNTGSWMYEPAFLGRSPSDSPYWPGTVVVLEDGEPPRLERLLAELPFATRSGR
jgi:calcineurin-like phosphoesterase family protein